MPTLIHVTVRAIAPFCSSHQQVVPPKTERQCSDKQELSSHQPSAAERRGLLSCSSAQTNMWRTQGHRLDSDMV